VAIALDTSSTGLSDTTVTSASVNISAAATGAQVFWCLELTVSTSNNLATPPTGWTLVAEDHTSGNIVYAIYTRTKQGGDTSYSATWTTLSRYLTSWVSYTGVDPTTPNETAAKAYGTTTVATVATGTATPAAAGRWALAFHMNRNTTGANTFTPDAALTERRDDGGAVNPWSSMEIADSNGIVTVASHSYTATGTQSSASRPGVLIYLIAAPLSASATLAVTASTSAAATRVATVDASSPITYSSAAAARGTFAVGATQPVTAGFSATPQAAFAAGAALAGTASFSAAATRTAPVAGVLAETASTSAGANTAQQASAALPITVAESAAGQGQFSSGATLPITVSEAATGQARFSSDAVLSVTAAQTAVDQVAFSAAASLVETWGSSATAVRVATVSAGLAETAGLTVAAQAVYAVSAALSEVVAAPAVADVSGGGTVYSIAAALSVAAATTSNAIRTSPVGSNLTLLATLAATVNAPAGQVDQSPARGSSSDQMAGVGTALGSASGSTGAMDSSTGVTGSPQ
jgi:hypothetical protein